MRYTTNTSDLPGYLVKSTFGVAFVSALILTPFGVNNLIQGRYDLGGLTFLISLLCVVNAWFCRKGRYLLTINLFAVAPAIGITIILATLKLGVVGSYWAFLVVLAFYVILIGKWALVANIIFVAIIIPVAWSVLEGSVAIRFSSVLIGTSIFANLSMREINKQHCLLKEQAVIDTLTGLYNRSLLQHSLDHSVKQSRRTNVPMTLVMFDVDFFKDINDKYGHDVGDSVLIAMGELLKKSFRESDMVFRIGGDEFLVLLYNTDEFNGLKIAEKLCQRIEKLPLAPGHTVTVSIGIAGLRPGMNLSEWKELCDKKLYRAKSNGRNQAFL